MKLTLIFFFTVKALLPAAVICCSRCHGFSVNLNISCTPYLAGFEPAIVLTDALYLTEFLITDFLKRLYEKGSLVS